LSNYSSDEPYPRIREPLTCNSANRSIAICARLNPYSLPDFHPHILLLDFALNERFGLRTEREAAATPEAVENRLRDDPELLEMARKKYAASLWVPITLS
jgi:hypothetical protein